MRGIVLHPCMCRSCSFCCSVSLKTRLCWTLQSAGLQHSPTFLNKRSALRWYHKPCLISTNDFISRRVFVSMSWFNLFLNSSLSVHYHNLFYSHHWNSIKNNINALICCHMWFRRLKLIWINLRVQWLRLWAGEPLFQKRVYWSNCSEPTGKTLKSCIMTDSRKDEWHHTVVICLST